MSLNTIAAHFTEEPVRVLNAEEPGVLTTLKMTYEGGSLDGKIANFPSRDVCSVVVGRHRGNWHSLETYNRTTWLNPRNRRTIFRCVRLTVQSSNSNWWKRLLATLHLRKLKTIFI